MFANLKPEDYLTAMLIELSPSQYSFIKSLLGSYSDYPVVNAVLQGNAPGRVFVDQCSEPQSAFVLTNAGFSYLMGSSNKDGFYQSLKELLDREIFPEIQSSDDPTLIFYPLSDGWETALKEILGARKVYNLFRKQFAFRNEKFAQHEDWRDKIPAGFSMHPIDQALLDETGTDMFPWESRRVFLEIGFGFMMMVGDEIACECRSVFVGGGAVEIDIHTDEKYQRRGLATIAASAFIEECLARGLRPNWECWWDNQPSMSLAQKLGFEPIEDHAVFFVELN